MLSLASTHFKGRWWLTIKSILQYVDANLLAFETRLGEESIIQAWKQDKIFFYWFHQRKDNKRNKQRQRSMSFHFKASCIFVKHLENEVGRVNRKRHQRLTVFFKRVGCCRCRADEIAKDGEGVHEGLYFYCKLYRSIFLCGGNIKLYIKTIISYI